MDWSYFDKFEEINNKYLPSYGEGETMATQICTAINKLVYKWYNDGDVFDNTYYLEGWWNDLSTYANWLAKYVPTAKNILEYIADCKTNEDYENLLAALADKFLTFEYLYEMNNQDKIGSIYTCKGQFVYKEYEEDEEDIDYWNDEDDDYYDDDEEN